jgi:SAM-dependent methyltransferase
MLRHADFAAPRAASSPCAVAGFIHLVSSAASLAFAARTPGAMPDAAWCWLEGVGAAVLGAAAGLPLWWLPINLVFAPAAQALLAWQIPATVYLAAFCLLFALNVAAWRHRVPLFLSSARAAAALAAWLPPRAGFRLLDLGCGTGSLLANLATLRPDGDYHGIETAPLSFALSWWRTRARAAVRVTWGDFWTTDLARYDVVYAYLSPQPMARLWQKARREMKPGSLLVSNSFAIPGVAPDHTVAVNDRMRSTLLVWRIA